MNTEPTKNQLKNAAKKARRDAAQKKFREESQEIIAAQSRRYTEMHGEEHDPWEKKEIMGEVCDRIENP